MCFAKICQKLSPPFEAFERKTKKNSFNNNKIKTKTKIS
jgi:hypothetical protein